MLFSSIALLILAPLFIPVIVILKMTGEGEVFYFQERIGKGGKPFKLIKFATMLKESPNLGTGTITTKDDPRILPFGKFLRKTKINELPQLINIIKGDMSIIGPRPQAVKNFEAYSEEIQSMIKEIKPGLSGIGSIVFHHEEEILDQQKESLVFYNEVIMPYKGELEKWYVQHKNIKIYFLMIILTIFIVIAPQKQYYRSFLPDLPEVPQPLKGLL